VDKVKMMTSNKKNSVQFLGAAGTVTGSKYLLNLNGKKILVDCGLFQGRDCRLVEPPRKSTQIGV